MDSSEYEWNTGFGSINYTVNLTNKNDAQLELDLEDTATNERWSGSFTSQYVEEITLKAGNFKKFSVFVKMLISSFDKENDSVYVDVLTYKDLEVLKARKAGTENANPSDNLSTNTTTATLKNTKTQMYL